MNSKIRDIIIIVIGLMVSFSLIYNVFIQETTQQISQTQFNFNHQTQNQGQTQVLMNLFATAGQIKYKYREFKGWAFTPKSINKKRKESITFINELRPEQQLFCKISETSSIGFYMSISIYYPIMEEKKL